MKFWTKWQFVVMFGTVAIELVMISYLETLYSTPALVYAVVLDVGFTFGYLFCRLRGKV